MLKIKSLEITGEIFNWIEEKWGTPGKFTDDTKVYSVVSEVTIFGLCIVDRDPGRIVMDRYHKNEHC